MGRYVYVIRTPTGYVGKRHHDYKKGTHHRRDVSFEAARLFMTGTIARRYKKDGDHILPIEVQEPVT